MQASHFGTARVAALLVFFATSARVVAGELPEAADEPSAFSTVIDARQYDDRFATVEELLGQVPGVRVRRFGGLGSYSTASIRGSKSEQVLVGIRFSCKSVLS